MKIRLRQALREWGKNTPIRSKLRVYYICVLVPLFLLTLFVLRNFLVRSREKQQREMETAAALVHDGLLEKANLAAAAANSINLSDYIDELLNREYLMPIDYMEAYQEYRENALFESLITSNYMKVTIYGDNDTLLNGGEFGRLSEVRDTAWYRRLQESGRDEILMFWYDDYRRPLSTASRKLLFVRRLNLITHRGCEKVVKVEIDYNSLVNRIRVVDYDRRIVLCQNGKVMLSSAGGNNYASDFPDFSDQRRAAYSSEFTLYGQTMQLYVLENHRDLLHRLLGNISVITVLLLFSLVLPVVMMRGIDRSVVERILRDRLMQQETDIARQNAELLALHSQINPHFMFNALESVRMHSVLRHEDETADMVEKLAVMLRQNAEWYEDTVDIAHELELTETYFALQKYRFGDRLSYQIEAEEDCSSCKVPKMTIVTFAENACVHGVESKTSGVFVFIRVFRDGEDLCIEVEDTGAGMKPELVSDLLARMNGASIEMLREKSRIGIINACLRIRMMLDGHVRFMIESEEGIGTVVQIRMQEYDRYAARERKAGPEDTATGEKVIC